MEFGTLVRSSGSLSDRDLVGLAIYFCDQVDGSEEIVSSDLYEVIDDARVNTLPKRSIRAHLGHLRREGFVSKNGRGYRLTIDGIDRYSELIGDVDQRGHDDTFIELTYISDEFYRKIVDDINKSYRYGIDDAVLVLSRKLLENLVIDILRARYGLSDDRRELFYNTNNRQFRRFSKLIENLETHLSDFEYYSDRLDESTIRELKDLKEQGDASAHSIEVSPPEEDMKQYKQKAGDLANILFYTLAKVRESSN